MTNSFPEGAPPPPGDTLPAGPAGQLKALLSDQQRRWRADERVTVETYLELHSGLAASPDWLLDLIYHEIVLREQAGDSPRLEEYVARFPALAEPLRLQFDVDRAIQRPDWLASSSATLARGSASGPGPATGPGDPPEIPGYSIVGVLGYGGMGVAYRAWQISLQRLVTLKMIRAGHLADPDKRARFRAEAETAARLRHPHIVQVFELGEHRGQPYIVMELLEGGSLAGYLHGSPQPPRAAAELVEPLARAAHYAHEEGVIHRDLKPANILLTGVGGEGSGVRKGRAFSSLTPDPSPPTPTPKISDFGLARRMELDSGQTRSGMIVGTPSYMAPEQALGRPGAIGPCSDIYGLGALLYELLTGRPPFQGASLLETLEQVRTTEPVPPRRLQPTVPSDLETICLKCLHKEPGQRYLSAESLAVDLRRFLAGAPIHARPVGQAELVWRWCRRNRATAVLLAAVVLLLVVGTAGAVVAAYQFRAMAADERRARADAVIAQQEAEANAREIRQSMERLTRAYRLIESGQAHVGERRLDMALAEFTEAAALRPDLSEAWSDRAICYGLLFSWELAAADLSRSFELHPSSEADICHFHASLRLFVGDAEGYRRTCAALAERSGASTPREAWWAADASTLAPDSGVDPGRLLQMAELALASDPQSQDYLRTLGLALYRAGRYQEAFQHLRRLHADDDDWRELQDWPVMAMCQHRLGRPAEARRWLEKTGQGCEAVLRQGAPFPDSLAPPGCRHYDPRKLVFFYREAQRLLGGDPGEYAPLCLVLQARGHAHLGQQGAAEAALTQAVRGHPEQASLWLCRGYFFAQQGRWADAAADFQRANAGRPFDDPWEQCRYALVHLAAGNGPAYRRCRHDLLARFARAHDPLTAGQTAWTCLLTPDAAPDVPGPIPAAQPEEPLGQQAAGLALLRGGHHRQAVEHFRRIADSALDTGAGTLSQLLLALAQHHLGEADEARRILAAADRRMTQAAAGAARSDLGTDWHFWAACEVVRQELATRGLGEMPRLHQAPKD